MSRLPDRFDLWVRKARECPDPARQTDYVLGALAALNEWFFFNIGTTENPRISEAEIENHRYKLVFSDHGRIEELVEGNLPQGAPLPVISMPTAVAMTWCIERKAEGCAGLLVNPGDFAAVVPLSQLEAFYAEWTQRGGRQASGFWIPNLTTEEEDFWQEHGL
jgi:hypothetical protein